MSLTGIIIATVTVAGTGLILGLFLGLAGAKFNVEVDQKELDIREALPGNNCGGCGYAGCDALAKAIAMGEAPPEACPVGGLTVAQAVAEILGVEAKTVEKQVSFVMCAGDCSKAKESYVYHGVEDCKMVEYVPAGGSKACSYGCHGYGNCVKVCKFDAIHIINGIAVVDEEKCTACSMCVKECPKKLIELVPYKANQKVRCSSKAKGKDVKAVCSIGCIACKLCEKACQFDAIHVTDNLAYIDYGKCTNCGKCAEKCPVKVITV